MTNFNLSKTHHSRRTTNDDTKNDTEDNTKDDTRENTINGRRRMSNELNSALSENDFLKEENLSLRMQLGISALPSRTPDQTSEVEIIKDPARKNGKLKPNQLPSYDGNRKKYPAWRKAVLSALRLDWNYLSGS